MARLLLIGVVAVIVFTVYSVIDCAFFDRSRVRGLPHVAWIVVILLVPVIGGVLWFLIGRGRKRQGRIPSNRTVAPDDDTDFLRRLATDAQQDERIRRLEQELAELDEPDGTGKGADRPGDGDGKPGESGSGPSGRPNG
jgi:hypothetical protein